MSAHTVSRSREGDYDTWRAGGGGAAWSALLREEELSLQAGLRMAVFGTSHHSGHSLGNGSILNPGAGTCL